MTYSAKIPVAFIVTKTTKAYMYKSREFYNSMNIFTKIDHNHNAIRYR